MIYKEWNNPFNSFQSLKALVHVPYWKTSYNMIHGAIDNSQELLGELPAPVAVTIDPCVSCMYECFRCNAKYLMSHTPKEEQHMGFDFCDELPEFLECWGVKAVTIAGGGEPLYGRYIEVLLRKLAKTKLETGMITNGLLIARHLDAIVQSCKWVGVSVDAGTKEVYEKVKFSNRDSDTVNSGSYFNKVIKNINDLASKNVDVTYKYLVNNLNAKDIVEATKIAKNSGCKRIHIRPVGNTWFDHEEALFLDVQIENILEQISLARELYEDENFSIYGITHKFGKNWFKNNNFATCHAIFTYLVISSGVSLNVCCDQRGNDDFVLAKNLNKPNEILEYWGSKQHLDMLSKINPAKCPRCTQSTVNQIFENVVIKDNCNCNFI